MVNKNFIDLSGKRFGFWTVLRRAPNDKNSHTAFFCRCDCGNEVIVLALSLTRGTSTKCIKCSQKYRHTFHGMSLSKTYSVYIQMIERCHNPKHASYNNYGERGIYVCSDWQESFKNFLRDMGEAPLGLSIERIDNNLGYSRENCLWVTWKEQCRNRRNTIHIGEINNGWEILDYHQFEKKTYVMKCNQCNFVRKIKSCNFRRMKK